MPKKPKTLHSSGTKKDAQRAMRSHLRQRVDPKIAKETKSSFTDTTIPEHLIKIKKAEDRAKANKMVSIARASINGKYKLEKKKRK